MARCPVLRAKENVSRICARSKQVDDRRRNMADHYDISRMSEKIRNIKKTAIELKEMSGGIQAVDRNVERILTAVRVLELDISDVEDIY